MPKVVIMRMTPRVAASIVTASLLLGADDGIRAMKAALADGRTLIAGEGDRQVRVSARPWEATG